MADVQRPRLTQGYADQRFLADVISLTPHREGEDWFHLQVGDGDGPIGLQIKIARDGERLEIVDYTTYNR